MIEVTVRLPAASHTHRVSDPVIRRFSPLPAKGEGLWSTVVDYQRSVLIQVLEGEARAGEVMSWQGRQAGRLPRVDVCHQGKGPAGR